PPRDTPTGGGRITKLPPTSCPPPPPSPPPARPTENISHRHKTLRPQKLLRKTAKDKTSRSGKSQSPPIGRSRRRAIRPAELQRSAHDTNTSQHETVLKPDSTAASVVNTIVCVMIDPAKPKGAIARTVRAQRNSCRQRLVREGSETWFSTM